MTHDPSNLRGEAMSAIDRHGAALAAWPDQAAANRVRTAALADRSVRAYLDDAAAMAAGLALARDQVDAAVEASGAVERLRAATLAHLTRRPRPSRWIAAAAVILVAAGLGSVADLRLVAPVDDASSDTLVIDPLVFGPVEADLQ